METALTIYTPRKRQENVAVIRDLMQVSDEQGFRVAMERFGQNYHPSLFSELDYVERRILEEKQRASVRKLNDELYLRHLDKIFYLRRGEIPKDDKRLVLEVAENMEFYHYLMEERPYLLKQLSDEQANKIQTLLKSDKQLENQSEALKDYYSDYHIKTQYLYENLRLIRDRQRIARIISTSLINTMLYHLDKLSSRLRAREFLYQGKIPFPFVIPSRLSNKQELEGLKDFLLELKGKAAQWRLTFLEKSCEASFAFLQRFPILDLKEFEGSYMEGVGPCARCSMHFASTALVCLDSTCQFLGEWGDEWIYIPANLNYIACPFCGEKAVVEAPAMFHSFERNQIIYCIPPQWRNKPNEAGEGFKGIFKSIREVYKSRLSSKEASVFDKSSELLTYGWSEFIYAIQMGEVDNVAHSAVVVQLDDKSGLLIDILNKVLIGIAPEKMDKYLYDKGPGKEFKLHEKLAHKQKLRYAIELYESRQVLESKQILEELLQETPEDRYVHYNLAVALTALGELDRARDIFAELIKERWQPFWKK